MEKDIDVVMGSGKHITSDDILLGENIIIKIPRLTLAELISIEERYGFDYELIDHELLPLESIRPDELALTNKLKEIIKRQLGKDKKVESRKYRININMGDYSNIFKPELMVVPATVSEEKAFVDEPIYIAEVVPTVEISKHQIIRYKKLMPLMISKHMKAYILVNRDQSVIDVIYKQDSGATMMVSYQAGEMVELDKDIKIDVKELYSVLVGETVGDMPKDFFSNPDAIK